MLLKIAYCIDDQDVAEDRPSRSVMRYIVAYVLFKSCAKTNRYPHCMHVVRTICGTIFTRLKLNEI